MATSTALLPWAGTVTSSAESVNTPASEAPASTASRNVTGSSPELV
ncbi:hypothetical protein [Actinacidiphila glaucinigra]